LLQVASPEAINRLAKLRKKKCSFLKKRTKKLLGFCARDPAGVQAKGQASFSSFLQEGGRSLKGHEFHALAWLSRPQHQASDRGRSVLLEGVAA
jgi:hypothetical protein